MADVVLESVSRRHSNGKLALDAVRLSVRDGELFVLLGPSGCGKTTLLRTIAGLEPADQGDVLLGGRRVNREPPRKRNVAMVFQDFALFPHRKVRDNLVFGLRFRRGGWNSDARGRASERAERAARLTGIETLLDRWPAELSGGEQQRVALARALVREPDVLLLDEPLSHADARARLELRRAIRQFVSESATTTIYVTHDQEEAASLGERIAVMREGRIEQVGTSEEVYQRPANRFVARFFGPLPMNLIAGSWRGTAAGPEFREREKRWGLPLPADWAEASQNEPNQDRPVDWGIRPEDVRIDDDGPLAVELESCEFWGNAQLAHARIVGNAEATNQTREERSQPDQHIAFQVQGRIELAAGQRLRLRLPLERSHWFDGRSGRRLSGG